MKKHNMFKVLGIVLLLVIISSYFLVGGNGTVTSIGIVDTVMRFFQSMYYFFYLFVFLLAVSGFYGVLSKSASYKKLLDNIVTKVKPLGRKVIFIIIILISIISSFTGLTLPLVAFIPFISAIILMLGYDKLVAMSATVGSIVVGYLGGVFVTFVSQNSGNMITYESFVGLESQFDNMFPKLLLLFAGIALLIAFVNSYIIKVENKKVKYELSNNDAVSVSEVSDDYKNIKTWPIAVTLIMLFLTFVLGTFPFNSLFDVQFFDSFHDIISTFTIGNIILRIVIGVLIFGLVQLVYWIISLIENNKFKFKVLVPILISIVVLIIFEIFNASKVFNLFDYSIIGKFGDLLSGNNFFDFKLVINSIFSDITAFGRWFSSGDSLAYLLMSAVLIIFALIVALIDKIKFDDVIDSVVSGIKKSLPMCILVMMAYTVLVISFTNGFFETLVNNYGKFNYGISSLFALIGSILNVDIYYIVNGVFSPILDLITDESIYSSVAIMFQGIYAIFTILSPTSILLVVTLSYFDIPYTTWIKYAWRFILGLILLLAFVTMLVVLL